VVGHATLLVALAVQPTRPCDARCGGPPNAPAGART